MNFYLMILGVLVASTVLVAATTFLSIWMGLLPGVKLGLWENSVRKNSMVHHYGALADMSFATTTATMIAQEFPSPADAPLVFSLTVASMDDTETIIGNYSNYTISYRSLGSAYQYQVEPALVLVKEAA